MRRTSCIAHKESSVSDSEADVLQHSSEIWRDYPELVPGVLFVEGVNSEVSVGPRVARFNAVAAERLSAASEAELPETQAWRRAFSRMGLKPTQYRCASESLLRRLRKEKPLPQIHPLVDLCNSISLAFAIPVAALEVAQITKYIEVRYASGSETYLAFSGDRENPEAQEVIFADDARRAHARRWTNRQSARSAVSETTTSALIVAEAMHETAPSDVERLVAALVDELEVVWGVTPKTTLLSPSSPRFEF